MSACAVCTQGALHDALHSKKQGLDSDVARVAHASRAHEALIHQAGDRLLVLRRQHIDLHHAAAAAAAAREPVHHGLCMCMCARACACMSM